jgi:membrane associated rhomboid family serine protease
MTSTPVGMRCPECARGKAATTRVVRGIPEGAPVATYVLIAINVVVFVAEMLSGNNTGFGFDASGEVFRKGALYGPAVANGDWWRLVTSGFLHAGFIHLAFNMFVLFVLGRILEPAIGVPRFLGIYFVSLLAGSFGALLLDPKTLTVGASGAIFGLMAATFVIARRRGFDQVASQIGFWIVLNLVISFTAPEISIGGHIGGLIAGGLCAFVITQGERQPRGTALPVEIGGMSVLAAVAVAGALLFVQTI